MKTPNGMYLLYSSSESRQSSVVPPNATPADLVGSLDVYGGVLRIIGVTPNGETSFLGCTENGKAYGEPFKAGVSMYAAILAHIEDVDDILKDTLLAYGAAGEALPLAANAIVNISVGVTYAD